MVIKWQTHSFVCFFMHMTIPNTELTLMAISHFYTMNDFFQLGRKDLFNFSNEKRQPNELALGEIPESFKACFEQMYEEFSGKVKESEDDLFGKTVPVASSIIPSPCKNINKEHECKSYCDWHQTFFHWNIINKKEFLTLMKLSVPQGRLLMPSLSEAELSLTKSFW